MVVVVGRGTHNGCYAVMGTKLRQKRGQGRTAWLPIRVSHEDKAEILRASGTVGLTMSAFVVLSALKEARKIKP
jgi:hypothetical protein